MREHPVPQDITGYQFHIIGEMTIKQFAEVGAGVILGFILYATNLPDLLKWPLIVIAVATGAMAAFVPFEQQPLDHWIVTFFRSLYKPTQYYWKKDARLPEVFNFAPASALSPSTPELDLNPARRERIKEFLVSLPEEQAPDSYTQAENNRLQSILTTFSTIPTVAYQKTPGSSEFTMPNLTLRTHPLRQPTLADQLAEQADSIPAQTLTSLTAPMVTDVQNLTAAEANTQTHTTPEQTGDILVPQDQPVAITAQQAAEDAQAQLDTITYSQPTSYMAANSSAQIDTTQMQAAINNVDLPFPSAPTEPNKLVGMTLSSQNDLLHEVIIEIKTTTGQVVRAVKSNSLGQFFISTPLRNGTYVITAEKEGYQFPDQQLILNGTVVQPLEVRSA